MPQNNTREIEDLIGNPPGWILHSGISLIAFVVSVVITGSAFISYPDRMMGKGIMISDTPPVEHTHPIEGVIDSIYYKDMDPVTKDSRIIYLDNLCNRDHLSVWIDFMERYRAVGHIPDYLRLEFPNELNLGELQPDYSQMQLAFESFQLTLRQSGVFRQINTLEKEINFNQRLQEVLDRDKSLTEEELKLIEKDYDRYDGLHADGVVSTQEEERSRMEMIRQRRQYNNTAQAIIQSDIRDRQLHLEIERLTEDRANRVNEHRIRMQELLATAVERIRDWEERYYIRARAGGKLQLADGLVKGRRIRAGEPIAHIVPEVAGQPYILVQQPAEASARLEQGMKALVRFDAWPQQEYGIYTGVVGSIALTPAAVSPEERAYDIRIPLPDTIITGYGSEIPYRPGSTVTVDFISRERSVLHRILDTFLNLLKNR